MPNAQCLTNVPIANFTDSTQLWNAKDECNLLYGNNSVYCDVNINNNNNNNN